MNTDENTRAMLRTISISVLAAIGLIALCCTLFFKNYADPTVLVAIISITTTAIGALITGRPQTQTKTETTNETPIQ